MTEEFIIKWTFSPIDYFEEPVEFHCKNEKICVENGRAESRIPPDRYIPDHSLRNQLHEELNFKFLAAQVLNHKPYTLNNPSLSHGNDITLTLEGLTSKVTLGNIDLIQYDKCGNIISDTRNERIKKRNKFAELAVKHMKDSVFNKILISYSAAVNDSNNELVHLYEVRDTMCTYFKGEKAATAALKIDGTYAHNPTTLCSQVCFV